MNNESVNYPVFFVFLSFVFLTSCSGSGGGITFLAPVSNTNFEASETFTTEVPVGNQTQLNLTGEAGEITISGVIGATSVNITAIKRVQSDSIQDAENHLQELDVNVQALANEISITTIEPIDDGGRNYIVDYTITMPVFLATRVLNIGGAVTLDSINNDVTVIVVGGKITLSNIVGSATVDLITGTIEGEVSLPLNGVIDMKTLTGDINLTIPANTSAAFSATVTIGTITVANLVLLNPVITPTFQSGTLGSGQGTITLEADQVGNITVSGF